MSVKKILLTTGDVDGIGLEITAKTLLANNINKNQSLIFIRSPHSKKIVSQKRWLNKLHTELSIVSTNNYLQALELANTNKLVELIDGRNPARWVEDAAQLCFEKKAHAIVTAPLSKPEIKKAGMSDLGHTDILKRVCKSKSANMGFVGEHFSVVLATGHIPISQVEKQLTVTCLNQSLLSCRQLNSFVSRARSSKSIGVLALNPHAGDEQLIGNFESRLLSPWIKKQRGCKGPLIPDVTFQKSNWSKYRVYLALYHDQGLIPFKQAHGMSGVHVTLGLPILRTSVDHGTAKDIFGKNIADPASLIQALSFAQKLVTKSL